MFSTSGKISVAQLAFFAAALLPTNYVLFKHRKSGFFGWLFICLLCIIRIVGAAMVIHYESENKPVSEAGLIISSIAVAPMIIGLSGVANESFGSIKMSRPVLFGWISELLIHMTTVGAIAILIVGYVKLEGTNSMASGLKTGLDLIRAGAVILVGIWATILAIVMTSFAYRRALRAEKQLAAGVVVALVCLLVRIVYLILASFINSSSFNLRTGGSLAERIFLNVLPEFILVLALLVTGFASRNINFEKEIAGRSQKSTPRPIYRS